MYLDNSLYMLKRRTWMCQSCLLRQLSYTTHRQQQVSERSTAKPAFHRLSQNAAKPWLQKKFQAPRDSTATPKTTQRTPRSSQGRITKTGISVLADIPIHTRMASKSTTKDYDEFSNLKLMPSVLTAIQSGVLKDLEYAEPSAIQNLAIPALLSSAQNLSNSSFLIAAETGSGKTLAYLAPLMHMLKSAETDTDLVREPGQPRAIILVPSIELVKQVGATVKSMCHTVKLSSAALLPNHTFRRAKNELLMGNTDVLVTMPARLAYLLEEGILSLKQLKALVVDEADTMLDTSFQDVVVPLLSQARGGSIIFCSATIPRSMDSYLRKNYAECMRLVSPKLHSIPRRIAMKFVDVAADFKGNKNAATHQILRDLAGDDSEPGKVKKVILFVNKRESVDAMCQFLGEKGISAMPFSRDTTDRAETINIFLTKDEDVTDQLAQNSMKVLVTTDLASRGIDTIAVKNVILYDIPYGTIDFLHRVGRTGRAGRRGRAYILMPQSRGQQWVKDIKRSAISGQPLH